MVSICPTITADNLEAYRQQMETAAKLSGRIHIDLADGVFAPRRLLGPDNLWWPNVLADLHVMYTRPFEHLELFIAYHPNLIIVQAEAEGDFLPFAKKLRQHGIQVGVALLPETPVTTIVPALEQIDHVLIFSGNLGYQGGSQADLGLLTKAKEAKGLKPTLELGWDGGVNAENARQLAAGGIDVLNVGSFIQHAQNPAQAYHQLQQAVA